MKTKILALAALLALLAIVGVAAAAQPEGDVNAPSVRCLNVDGFCNDFKLVFNQPVAGYATLNGYEYGCGFNDRIATGSGHIVGSTLYIGFTVNQAAEGSTPRLGNWTATINRQTGAATGEYSYSYDGYHYGTATGTWGACSKDGPTGGPDAAR